MEAEGHRKIELQDPEDLAYLIANVRRAARERIDEAFPVVNREDGGADDLRLNIEQLVEEYITKTFTLASQNLSINGLPVDPTAYLSASTSSTTSSTKHTVYEPFDHRKHQRVIDLAAEEENLLREIANLKRKIPAGVAASFAEGVREGSGRDEVALAERAALDCAAAGEEVDKRGGALEEAGEFAGGRGEDVRESWRGAVQGLERLVREMPPVVAKMERARVAGEYVVTSRR